jgi:predicted ATPase
MVQLDDLSEAGNQHVMQLLALMDRRGEAMAQYDAFWHSLAVQMGAEPGIETKALYQHLCDEEMGASLWHLPASLTPIVGRRHELDDLWGLLRNPRVRLICIQGPGGSGKTRLALEAASRLRYSFRDGVHFVSLSALGAGSSLLAAVAERLGFTFREGSDPKRQLLDYMRNKKVLLVLDSFETVVESAGLIAELLSASQGSKALVTSRVRLNLSGERVYPLEGMRVPPSDTEGQMRDYSSVELFMEAAQRVKPGYEPGDLEGVTRICRLVEGMPLGLLLASTWVSDYSAYEIAEQISRSLDFLSVEWADLPERQRSLRATFEYSWKLLSPREQETLMSLAVFRNPFTAQAAKQVAEADPHLLHSLSGKSLLSSSASFYHMHDLVRQYSLEKLAEAPDEKKDQVHHRHGVYFLEKAERWEKLIKGPQQSSTLKQADKEIDDVRDAWDWATQLRDIERLCHALEGLMLYYFLRYRFQEGDTVCRSAIKALRKGPREGRRLGLEGWLLAWRTHFCDLLGNVDFSRRFADECKHTLDEAGDTGLDTRRGQALMWRERGYLAGSLNEQLDCFTYSAELFQSLGDTWWQAVVMSWAGELVNRLGDRCRSKTLLEKAVLLSREAGEPRRLAYSLTMLAYHQLIFGPWEIGVKSMEEAASWYRSVGDLGSQANANLNLGMSLGWAGRYPEACLNVGVALELFNQLGDRYYVTYSTLGVGIAQMNSSRYEKAYITFQKVLEAARKYGFRREEAFCLVQMGCLKSLMGEAEQALSDLYQGVAGFRQMKFAGELGMALGGFALAQQRLGQENPARESLQEALYIEVGTHSRFTLFTLPAALVVLLADAGRWEKAVEAYAAVMTDPIVANSRWFTDMIGNRMELAREHLPEKVYQAAEARGREGDVFNVLGRLLKEIESWDMVHD